MVVDISLPLGLGLRLIQPQDHAFAEMLFFSTRDYLYQIPIPKSQVDALIKQQYQMQQASYKSTYPAAETFIIEQNSLPLGKLILANTHACLHVIDIVLVSSARSKGFGRALLYGLKDYAAQQGWSLRLAVDQQNIRAKSLYLKLGFSVVESSMTHDTLLWT